MRGEGCSRQQRNLRARAAFALILGLAVLSPESANGQPASDAQRALNAQALYEQATSEMDAGSYATACPKLEEVTRLVPEGLGAKLTLARCYEAAQKLASAWAQYALVHAMASKSGQTERAQAAHAKATELKPRLALLTIQVPPEVRAIPGLTITRDEVPVGAPQWGTPLPVDKGDHTIVAAAPGRAPWSETASITADGASASIVVHAPTELAKPEPVATEQGGTGGAGDAGGAGIAGMGRDARDKLVVGPGDERTFQRPLGIAAMALGGAGVVAGAVLGGLAIVRNNDSNRDNHCNGNNVCDTLGLELRHQAVVLGNASTITIIAGSVVLAGGVALFATAPSGARLQTAIELLPGRIQVTGQW
jgi:hypothetical protein